jgi:hypothetical protein
MAPPMTRLTSEAFRSLRTVPTCRIIHDDGAVIMLAEEPPSAGPLPNPTSPEPHAPPYQSPLTRTWTYREHSGAVRLKRIQYRPGLIAGFLARTGLDLHPP